MKSLLTTVKRFLNAEEVPRWFGLTIVLIYLVGLGSVAYLGVSEARRDGSKWFQRQSCYAVELLADRLATLPATNPSGNGQANTERMAAYCHELQAFRARVPSRWVRIVDGTGSIVASSDPNDTLGADPDAPSVTTSVAPSSNRAQEGDRLIRVPIRTAGNVSKNPEAVPDGEGADQAPPDPLRSAPVADTSLILEARLPWQPYAEGSLADHAGTLVAVLAALGALFMTYRCLRQQMRGVSRIADRLASHHERLEEELDALRIGDVAGGVTDTWNRLIEMTQHFREAVQRTDANKELFNALQESGHGALADALNVIPDGIIYITDEVRFEFANAAARRLLGWEADRVRRVTLPDAESTGVGQLVLDRIRGALRPDGTYEDRTEVLQGDPGSGDGGSYRLRITPLQRATQSRACIVVIRDVSQQIKADHAREEFIMQVTHELRTPLTNIRAYTETLSSGMFDDPAVITECYNVITKETRRLSRLIEDILNVSQMEVGAIELNMDDVDLKALLTESVQDVRGLADEKGIDLQLVLPAKLERFRGDRDKLAVVMNNLLGNAIKYTPTDGNVVVGCRVADDQAVVTVKDNGIGIDPAEQRNVFEKFRRAADPDVQSEPGTGVGLYTAREIVSRHRGVIELLSRKGEGSTFIVRLPVARTRSAALSDVGEE